MNHLNPIIISLLDNDLYKFTMLQMFLHQFPDAMVEWTYKNRSPNMKFTPEMIDEINWQIDEYCKLRFTEPELKWLGDLRFAKPDVINYLRMYQPNRKHITCTFDPETEQPVIHFYGPNVQVSWHEVPVMAIVAEVYFRMHYSADEQRKAMEEARTRLRNKILLLRTGKYCIGKFSEFGGRRRFCREFHEEVVRELNANKEFFYDSVFVGTSNMYFAMKYNLTANGTMAHEAEMVVGQGYPMYNPAYTNRLMMDAWYKEYGTDNGIYLTDCIGTKVFYKDFTRGDAKLFSGLRHDSGDPFDWGETAIREFALRNVDPKTKTLLFSDSLNLEKADKLYRTFSGRAMVAFGIGTFWTNDTGLPPANQVIKITEVNGIPACKLPDDEGKFMGKSTEHRDNLKASIKWRLEHE